MDIRVEDFFIEANSVDSVTEENYRDLDVLLRAVDSFSRSTYQSVYVIQPVISIGPHTRYSGNIYPIVFHSHPFRNGPIVVLALYHFIP